MFAGTGAQERNIRCLSRSPGWRMHRAGSTESAVAPVIQMQFMTHVGSRVLAGCPCPPRASGRLIAIVFFQTPCVQWNVPQAEFGVGTGACCAGPCDVGCHLIRWEQPCNLRRTGKVSNFSGGQLHHARRPLAAGHWFRGMLGCRRQTCVCAGRGDRAWWHIS